MSRVERLSVWISTALVTVTGLAFAWMKYVLEPADPWAVINHPLQPWLLKAHILTAPILVFAVGSITLRHVWRHWKSRAQAGRRSGTLAALTLVPMIFTGYLIQAVTSSFWLTALGVVHLGVGTAFAGAVLVHRIRPPERDEYTAHTHGHEARGPAAASPKRRLRSLSR